MLTWLRHNVAISAFLMAAAGLIAWMAWSEDQAAPAAPVTKVVRLGNVESVVAAPGNVEPGRLVEVGARVSGQLKKLHVERGDIVAEGDLLAEIDDLIQVTHVASAEASLAALEARTSLQEADLELSRSDFQRQKRLMEAQATTEIEFDRAALQVAHAEVGLETHLLQIKQARAALDEARAQLNFTRLWAPASGTIVEVLAEEGQMLTAGQVTPVILKIGDLGTIRINAKIPEVDVVRLTMDMEAYITTLGGGERRWQARLKDISPLPAPGSSGGPVYFDALLEADNSDGALLPGISTQVFFLTAVARNVLKIPLGAIQAPTSNRATVLVVQPDGALERRPVHIGVTNTVEAEVVSGLEAGERVVMEPSRFAAPAEVSVAPLGA